MSKLHLTQSGTGCWVSLGALQIAVYHMAAVGVEGLTSCYRALRLVRTISARGCVSTSVRWGPWTSNQRQYRRPTDCLDTAERYGNSTRSRRQSTDHKPTSIPRAMTGYTNTQTDTRG